MAEVEELDIEQQIEAGSPGEQENQVAEHAEEASALQQERERLEARSVCKPMYCAAQCHKRATACSQHWGQGLAVLCITPFSVIHDFVRSLYEVTVPGRL